jgi:hypothetical protein
VKSVSFLILLFGLCLLDPMGSQSTRQDVGWKTYRNAHYNFSLKYPADKWIQYEGVDRNGVGLTPRDKSNFKLRPEIGAGGAVGQPSETDDLRSRNLEEDFQIRLDALKEYWYARNLVVLSKEPTAVQGLAAIVSIIRYEDSSNGQIWFDKDILIHTEGDSPTYHLSLHCSPDDAAVLVPLFDRISKTFRILGPPA